MGSSWDGRSEDAAHRAEADARFNAELAAAYDDDPDAFAATPTEIPGPEEDNA